MGVDDPRLLQILEQLRASRFAEIKGARASFSIPVSERLLNEADRRDDAIDCAASRRARAAAGGQPPGGPGEGVAPRLPASR